MEQRRIHGPNRSAPGDWIWAYPALRGGPGGVRQVAKISRAASGGAERRLSRSWRGDIMIQKPVSADAPSLLTVRGVGKSYPGVQALRGVDIDLRPGEVHALVGENGAGKSTLIRILSGATQPDAGSIAVNGTPVSFASPREARSRGIVTIFQELAIVPSMTVAENIVLGNEPATGPGRQIYDRRAAEALARDALAGLGCEKEISPRTRAGALSTGQKQIVEIARALALKAPVIILDEPTASLSGKEADLLLAILRRLRAEGTSILYVSHRLNEILELADRVTVLRGGVLIGTRPTSAFGGSMDLIEMMVGRPLGELFPPRNAKIGAPALKISGLRRSGLFENISFEVRAGEVLGFAGLIGAGRTEIMRAIFGADRRDAGQIEKGGRRLAIRKPSDAIRSGIAYIPEDRKDQGLVTSLSGHENLLMASLGDYCTAGIVSWRTARQAAEDIARRLQFRGQLARAVRTNSGGNQQKIVIGKWMLSKADVFIFDEPTRGIDVGAKAEIYRQIQELAAQGAAIIVVSSEISELMHLCHRMLVVSAGRIEDELACEEFDEQRILAAAFKGHAAEAGTHQ
ncbi:sugar ABC transporter ATP-binding protein [Xanthobacter sp. KR7-225]|uniref:sugar ABC transporter ATP-binding protein n=1 Tax=Xanthobacter sp. KR7-225 TaxID=3156613 RepID=UPI0032B33316